MTLQYGDNMANVSPIVKASIQMLESMKKHLGASVTAYDPFVKTRLADGQVFDYDEFLSKVDIVVILTAHTHIKENLRSLDGKIVFDTRNVMPSGEKVYKL